MNKSPLLSAILVLLSTVMPAQVLQLGFGVAANNTFFHRGNSVYDEDHHGRDIFPAGGVQTVARLRLTDSWSLRSGPGFHIKQYRVLTEDLDIPGIDGYFYFESGFGCLELPLLIAFKTPKPKAFKFEYRLGAVSSWYFPARSGGGSRFVTTTPYEAGVVRTSGPAANFWSPDLFCSVALLNINNKSIRQEFSISFQYGLLPTSGIGYTSYIISDGIVRTYTSLLEPTLSSFMLSYTFYPDWLRFGGGGEFHED